MNPDLSAPLTHEEFVSLRDCAKGLMHRTIPAEHKDRLIQLGYIQELSGGLRLERFPKRLTRGFPWGREHDSRCLLGGGQQAWRSRIRRICVGEWLGRSRAGPPSRKLRSNGASASALSFASSSFTGRRAASSRPNSAATKISRWRRMRIW